MPDEIAPEETRKKKIKVVPFTEKFPYRHELKYLINPGYYTVLRQRLRAAMIPDRNGSDGQYRITSLYFDDVYRSAYNDKLLGAQSRKKHRIRIYNGSPDRISLELKTKEGEFVGKKNALLTEDEFMSILGGDCGFLSQERFDDTAGADFYAASTAALLKPSVAVDYVREAFTCREGNVRITFDMNLRTALDPDILHNPRYIDVFPRSTIILEVKYDTFIPSYIEGLLGGMPLIRESVSKFVYCQDKLIEIKKCS